MIRYFIPLFCLFCLSCQGEHALTEADLQGHWKFVSTVKVVNTTFLNKYPNPYAPATEVPWPQFPYVGPDLVFENDSLHTINYPTNIVSRNSFSIDSGYLHNLFSWHIEAHPVEFFNDTLFIYKPFYQQEYVKEGYIKTNFNDSILSILKSDGVYYPELAGTWFLVRESSGEDGTYYELDFPHVIPDSIKISREDFIHGLENDKIYMMSTDGIKREYFFDYRGYLHLTPGDWYEGEDLWIHLSK